MCCHGVALQNQFCLGILEVLCPGAQEVGLIHEREHELSSVGAGIGLDRIGLDCAAGEWQWKDFGLEGPTAMTLVMCLPWRWMRETEGATA